MANELHFRHTVVIDGMDLAGITLAGATINYGVRREGEAPTPADAYFTLVSADAVPNIADTYPGFTWGDRIPSGFTDTYEDEYEGGLPRLKLMSPVTVNAATPTGFRDTYSDTYDGGYDSARFTGVITAIDVQPATIAITAVTASEALTRVLVNPSGWPEEPEKTRVQRILAAAGAVGVVNGVGGRFLAAAGATENPVSAWSLLSAMSLALDAILYTDRHGVITYTCHDAGGGTMTDLAPGATLLDGLTLTTEIGAVVNDVTVDYGPAAARLSVQVEDAESIALHGRRPTRVATSLRDTVDATAKANRVLAHHKDPVWHMPAATVNLRLAQRTGDFPAYMQEVLSLDLDDAVTLPDLLPASPMPSYMSRVLGYTEVLDPYSWTIAFALNPAGWTRP